MRDGFDTVVGALWRNLGLGDPPGGEAVRLRIDGRTVTLRAAPDGVQVLVQAGLGRLDADAGPRAGQLRRLMRDGLGTVLGNRAALCLSETGQIEAVAAAPCRLAALPALRAAIEDVLHLLDIHATALAEAPDPRSAGTPPSWSPADSLIFRL